MSEMSLILTFIANEAAWLYRYLLTLIEVELSTVAASSSM